MGELNFAGLAGAHRGGWALVRSTWASWLQYRGFFFVLAFGWMIPPLIALFVWTAAAAGGEVGGLARGEFVAYYLVLMLVNQLTYSQTNWTVGDMIRYGGLTPWLLRPIPPLYNVLSGEAAGKLVYLIFTGPAVILLALLLSAAGLPPELNAAPRDGLLFVPALVMAWGLRFFWGLWIAMLAFWATRADALLAVQDSLVFLLSGVAAPVLLLPVGMQVAARVLPFRYMVGFPVEVLTGQLSAPDLALGFALQAGWLALALVLSALVWRAGVRHYSAVGG